MNKYRNVKTECNGHLFDSKKEAVRYRELLLMQHVGLIRDLELQKVYPLVVNGVKIGKYIADFVYVHCESGTPCVEDTKGVRTQTYNLKKKLMKALHNIDIQEI